MMRLADTAASGWGPLPGKEGQDGARPASLVAIIEMISAGIVEIDRLLDEAQAEVAGVEAKIPDGITGNRGDVVQPRHVFFSNAPGAVLLWPEYRSALDWRQSMQI